MSLLTRVFRWILCGMFNGRCRVLAALPLMALMTGCQLGISYKDEVQTRYIDYYKVQCDEDDADLCFRIRESTSDSWSVVDVPFSGFSSFVWGHRYQVSVTVSFDDSGHPESYRFDHIVTDTEVDDIEDTFALTLHTDTGVLTDLGDDTWQLGGEIEFDCLTSCAALSSSVANDYVAQLEFSVTEGVIALENLICAAAEADFDSDCEGETEESWYVAWYQSDCGLASAAMCLLYKVNSSDEYELLQLDSDIAEFEPEWGEQYRIDVTKTVSDGGNITAVSLDADDSSPDDRANSSYEFLFIVRGSVLDTSDSAGLIDLYDGSPAMDCDSYSQCGDVDDYIEDEQWMLLEAFFDGVEIQVLDVVCHSASLSSFRTCVSGEDDVHWGI